MPDRVKHIFVNEVAGFKAKNPAAELENTGLQCHDEDSADAERCAHQDADYEEISKLQKRENDTYQELDNILDDYQNVFNPVTTPRFDNYDVQIGDYNDYMNYVPIVWTHGEQQDNRRIKWDTEKRHNSYGAPIWKTGVGYVELKSATAETVVLRGETAEGCVLRAALGFGIIGVMKAEKRQNMGRENLQKWKSSDFFFLWTKYFYRKR